jgi:hypothetical protein
MPACLPWFPSVAAQHDPGRTSHMVYRRKGSGEPPSCEKPSHSDEPPSARRANQAPTRKVGAPRQSSGLAFRDAEQSSSRFGGRKTDVNGSAPVDGKAGASSRTPKSECSVCGRRTWLFGLPGQDEKYCYECSADVATSLLLTTEIDAATFAGQDANSLITEFQLLSYRLLARAQSA